MKKSFKRAGVAVLSMAMLLSMGAVGAMTASAADVAVKVAVSDIAGGAVKAYKVAAKSSGTWAWANTALEDAAKSVNSEYNDFSKFSSEENDSQNLKKLAAALSRVSKDSLTKVEGNVGTDMTISEPGYYLFMVTPKDSSTLVQPVLKEIKGDETTTVPINAKGEKISVTKTITAVTESDGTTVSGNIEVGGKNANASSGDIITYKIVSPIPSYNPGVDTRKLVDYVLTDTYKDTLEYKSANAFVGESAAATSGDSVTVVPETNSFTVTLSGDDLLAAGSKYLIVEFKATLKDNPTISKNSGVRSNVDDADNKADANTNDVTLTYGNDYTTGRYYDKNEDGNEDKNEKPEEKDYADVYTTGIEVTKTMGASKSTPADDEVEFELYKDAYADGATPIRAAQGVKSGKVNFVGLEPGRYVIHESKKSDTYKGAADVTVVIDENGSVAKFTTGTGTTSDPAVSADNTGKGFTVTINNPDLETLPGTGGMGTVLFTVGGASIVLLAGAMFVVYMRKRKNEE